MVEAGQSNTVLPRVAIKIRAEDGGKMAIQCLTDQGSQSSYIAEDIVEELSQARKRTNIELSGMGCISAERVSAWMNLKIRLEEPQP